MNDIKRNYPGNRRTWRENSVVVDHIKQMVGSRTFEAAALYRNLEEHFGLGRRRVQKLLNNHSTEREDGFSHFIKTGKKGRKNLYKVRPVGSASASVEEIAKVADRASETKTDQTIVSKFVCQILKKLEEYKAENAAMCKSFAESVDKLDRAVERMEALQQPGTVIFKPKDLPGSPWPNTSPGVKPPDREEWIHLKKGCLANRNGFNHWVMQNLDRIQGATKDDMNEMQHKWHKLYPTAPWPVPVGPYRCEQQKPGLLRKIFRL